MDLYHLIYQSQAMGEFGAPELAALLHRGRAHNQANNISGVLLHTSDGRFLQVLEGPKSAVRHLFYHVILSDTRHFHCQTISEGPCAQRSFAGWTMGCRVARPEDLRALLGEAPADCLGLTHRPYPAPSCWRCSKASWPKGPPKPAWRTRWIAVRPATFNRNFLDLALAPGRLLSRQ